MSFRYGGGISCPTADDDLMLRSTVPGQLRTSSLGSLGHADKVLRRTSRQKDVIDFGKRRPSVGGWAADMDEFDHRLRGTSPLLSSLNLDSCSGFHRTGCKGQLLHTLIVDITERQLTSFSSSADLRSWRSSTSASSSTEPHRTQRSTAGCHRRCRIRHRHRTGTCSLR